MTTPPPLSGIRCLEFAGLAPGPFAGMLLADYGATVLRVDRASSGAHSSKPPPPSPDNLVRHKSSICVDFKSAAGIALIRSLLPTTDVVIDPFRPGVLEKLGLGPDVIAQINPRCILARMTGFRRDGKYAQMAGHDINYIAVSGILSMLGRKDEKPHPPGNIIGDFAGGGAVCFMGILLALLSRQSTGRGQVVEANMVDGSAYLATMPRLAMKPRATGGPAWDRERGTNLLDGGAPFYQTYETRDKKYMSVGALEPQFFDALMKGLGMKEEDLPGSRMDPKHWPAIEQIFTRKFRSKTRLEWESIFDGTDACVAPVLTQQDLEKDRFDHRPIVTLKDSPAHAIASGDPNRSAAQGQGVGVKGEGWAEEGLPPGVNGEEVLGKWLGWERGKHFEVKDGGIVLTDSLKSKL